MYIHLYEHYTDKNNKKLVHMSCTEYNLYTFHPSLHHTNFGQFKAKQVFCVLFGIKGCFFLNLFNIFLGERASIVKRDDNLHPEGDFQKRPDQKWAPGERANVIRRDDNLQPEGEFQKRPDEKWAPGERANVVRRDDNLHPEGAFQQRPDQKWAPGIYIVLNVFKEFCDIIVYKVFLLKSI